MYTLVCLCFFGCVLSLILVVQSHTSFCMYHLPKWHILGVHVSNMDFWIYPCLIKAIPIKCWLSLQSAFIFSPVTPTQAPMIGPYQAFLSKEFHVRYLHFESQFSLSFFLPSSQEPCALNLSLGVTPTPFLKSFQNLYFLIKLISCNGSVGSVGSVVPFHILLKNNNFNTLLLCSIPIRYRPF